MTKESLKDSGLDPKAIVRSKNMFTLGMCYYMFNRPMEYTFKYIKKKFKKNPALIDANQKVLQDGYNYASNIQAIPNTYRIEPANGAVYTVTSMEISGYCLGTSGSIRKSEGLSLWFISYYSLLPVSLKSSLSTRS
ncbi:hypothetical protein MASR1M46_14660 [Bacteroidales bacterium]